MVAIKKKQSPAFKILKAYVEQWPKGNKAGSRAAETDDR